MSKFGPYPESDFHCPIKGAVCDIYGIAVYSRWQESQNKIELEKSLGTRLQQAEAVLNNIYPMIAGRVIHLKEAGEIKAMNEWNEVAKQVMQYLKR